MTTDHKVVSYKPLTLVRGSWPIIPVTDIQATPYDDSTIDVWRYGRNRTNFVKRGKNFNNMISLLDMPHDVPIYGTIADNILIFAANS